MKFIILSILFISVLNLASCKNFIEEEGIKNSVDFNNTEFENYLMFDDFHQILVSYDLRLESFIEDFYLQVNEIIESFPNAIYYQEIDYIMNFLSSQSVIVENGDISRMNALSFILSMLEANADYSFDDFQLEQIQNPAPNNLVGTFIRTVCRDSLSGIQIGLLYRQDSNYDRLIFRGAVFEEPFERIILIFSTTVLDGPFQGRQITYEVSLGLENLQFRIQSVISH